MKTVIENNSDAGVTLYSEVQGTTTYYFLDYHLVDRTRCFGDYDSAYSAYVEEVCPHC